jgi:putative type I restriction-modification system, S subunit
MNQTLIPLKYVATITLGKMLQNDASSLQDVELPYVRAASIGQDGKLRYDDAKTMWFKPNEVEMLSLLKGDVLVVEGGDVGRSIVLSQDEPGWGFQNSINRVRPFPGNDGRFLQYQIEHLRACGYLRIICNAVSFHHLTAEKLAAVQVRVPISSQQQRIADYLDIETTKIDRLIAKQRELMDLLRIRNEAKWHAAFTGFTPVKTRPLKRLLVKLRRPALEASGVVTAFRDGEVTLRSNRREEGFTFSETETGYQGVAVGDLVFHGLDGFAGAVGISDSDGQSTPVYHVCRLRDDEDNLQFIAYLLRYLGHSGFLATQAPSVRQRAVDFRNWQTFGQIPLSLPDPEEQQRIVTELDKNAAEFLNTKTTIEKAIELLQERRSALITAAVTGQIEV